MSRDTLEYLVPIIDHIARCNPKEREDVLHAINYIKKYFKKLQSASTNFERRSIEAPNASAYPGVDNFGISMTLLHENLKALRTLLPPKDLVALSHQLASSQSWDRYSFDFDELKIIGTGAYGIVVTAKHFLDGKQYAIKKIPLKSLSQDDSSDILNEVQILSRLDHPQIAKYHSSWLQLHLYSSVTICEDVDESSSLVQDISTSSSDLETFVDSDNSSSSGIIFEENSLSISDPKEDQNNTDHFYSRWLSPLNSKASEFRQSHDSPLLPTLFIQMELGGENLKEWLTTRNQRFADGKFLWRRNELVFHLKIFRKILFALNYVHSKRVIHRDIKPANVIFTKGKKDVILADFGLAKLLEPYSKYRPRRRRNSTRYTADNHTTDVGTPTYAAPEAANSNYNFKVDIYSLGILLLELLHPFGSMFERAKVITDLREKRFLDESFKKKWTQLADLVLRMTEADPKKRPTAAEILNFLHHRFFTVDLRSEVDSEQISPPSVSHSQSEKCIPSKVAFKRQNTYPIPRKRTSNKVSLRNEGFCLTAAFPSSRPDPPNHPRRKQFKKSFASSNKSLISKLKTQVKELEAKNNDLIIKNDNLIIKNDDLIIKNIELNMRNINLENKNDFEGKIVCLECRKRRHL